MKLLHTADLHIGKIVNEVSMLFEQKYILEEILKIAESEKVDGIILAGDIYDRSVPPAEAVSVLDSFLTELVKRKIKVYMISGNHDSAERIGFASKLLNENGVYIAGVYDQTIKKIRSEKDGVVVDFYLLPFAKPQVVSYFEKQVCEKEEEFEALKTYESAVKASLSHLDYDKSVVNILVTHHFVTSRGQLPEQSDSESNLSLGGIDQVDASVFDAFDYVALGHIHGPQRIGRDTIRYAGSPLKYSFSEVNHKKSITILNISENHEIEITVKELHPFHDMRKIRGPLQELMNPKIYEQANREDYIQAILTDEIELLDPIGTLRSVYPNIMQVVLEKNGQETKMETNNVGARKHKTPMELFEEFYESVTGNELDEKRENIMKDIIEEVMGGEEG